MNLSASARRSLFSLVVCLSAAVLGLALALRSEVVLTVGAAAALVVCAALFKPETLLTLAAIMIPFRAIESLVPISRGGVTLADGFLIAFVLSSFARKRTIERRRVPAVAVIVIVALVAVSTASMLQSAFLLVGVRKIARMIVIGLALLAAARCVTLRDAERVTTAFLVSAAASSVVGLAFLARAAAVPGIGILRLWGGVEDPNHMSLVIAVAIILAVSWRGSSLPSAIWLGSVVLCLVAQFASLSRGGAAAFVVGLGVLLGLDFFARMHGRVGNLFSRSSAVLLAAAALAAMGAAFIPSDIASSATLRYQGILDPRTDATGALRFRIWDAGFGLLARSPVVGIGPGAFGLALVASGAFTTAWEAHNSIVEIAVETGYLGISLALLALMVGGILCLRAFGAAVRRTSSDEGQVALSAGLIAAAACVVAGGASLSNVLYGPLFAIVLILAFVCLAEVEESS